MKGEKIAKKKKHVVALDSFQFHILKVVPYKSLVLDHRQHHVFKIM